MNARHMIAFGVGMMVAGILMMAVPTNAQQPGQWRGMCSTDIGQLAAQVGNASQVVVVDRPHAQSGSAILATSRMCVLARW